MEKDNARRTYMRKWVDENRERIRAYRDSTKDERNRRRRELYARDEYRREIARSEAKRWQENNAEKRFAQRLRPYGITPDRYRELLAAQGGGCAICHRPESPDVVKVERSKSRRRRLHVDHCHATGRVRGLLCSSCNMGIGKFNDDPCRIERAAMYLREGVGSTSPD